MLTSQAWQAAVSGLFWLVPLALSLQFTNKDFSIKPDKPFEVTWEGQTEGTGFILRVIEADDDSVARTYDAGMQSAVKVTFSEEINSGKYYFELQETTGDQIATSETFRYDNVIEKDATQGDRAEDDDEDNAEKSDTITEDGTEQESTEKDDTEKDDNDSGSIGTCIETKFAASTALALAAILAL